MSKNSKTKYYLSLVSIILVVLSDSGFFTQNMTNPTTVRHVINLAYVVLGVVVTIDLAMLLFDRRYKEIAIFVIFACALFFIGSFVLVQVKNVNIKKAETVVNNIINFNSAEYAVIVDDESSINFRSVQGKCKDVSIIPVWNSPGFGRYDFFVNFGNCKPFLVILYTAKSNKKLYIHRNGIEELIKNRQIR